MDQARIAQFKKMAEADPENELGHFSLGKAYLDAGMFAEAIAPLQRAVELSPRNSRAYHLLGSAQTGIGDLAAAIATLRTGYEVANQRGDLMPRNEIAALLEALGETLPESDAAPSPSEKGQPTAVGEGQVQCSRCGGTKPKMAERPFKGALGEQVLASVCADCWREWIPMGTKVINELRLDFADPKHAELYDQHMKEFLGLS